MVYTYDDDGRMSTAANGGQTTTYAYDAAGNAISAILPTGNGYIETRTYDNAGRMTELKNQKGATVLSRSTYTLDPVGNRSTILTTTGTTTLTYDANDRLTQACYIAACTGSDNFRRYTYDDVGNRLTEVSAAGTTSYTYDALDQLVSSSGVGGNVTYTFNLDGDQTGSGTQTMTYDLAHRLKTLSSGTTTTTYSYAGDGARVEASTGTQASKKTRYVWDPNRSVPELVRELDGNNALVREYQYGLDLISMKAGSSSYYFHHDGLGSVLNVTSSTGVTQWTYDYHPYGVARTTMKNSNQAPTNQIQFAGEYLDPTGLYHLRARQLAPSVGRFTSPDPIRGSLASAATSSYLYAGDNPINFVDPLGLESLPPQCNYSPLERAGRVLAGGIVSAGGILTAGIGVVITGVGVGEIVAAGAEEVGSSGLATVVVAMQVQGGIELVTVYGPGTFVLGGTLTVAGVAIVGSAFC